jgi:hypothetical protein
MNIEPIECGQFKKIAEISLDKVLNNEDTTFSMPELEKFLLCIDHPDFKGSSKNKSDIVWNLCDLKINISNDYIFSIKSELGGNSTI